MSARVEIRRRDDNRAAKLFCTSGDIESVQPIDKAGGGHGASGANGFLRLGNHVDGLGSWVNDRSRGDANFWIDVVGVIRSVLPRHGSHVRPQEAGLPKQDARGRIRVIGVHAVVLRG